MTDDQDLSTLSPEVQPNLYHSIADQGTHFTQFFTPVSLCCPSRVSLLRAQHAHNHNVTYVSAPYGGWSVFNQYGYTHSSLLDFVQAEGYGTYYTGKLMNGHTSENCASLPVSGVTEGEFLVDPWTYDYWAPGFCSSTTGQVEVRKKEYSTDVVAEKVFGHLDKALSKDEPFFLTAAPIGPHSHMPGEGRTGTYDMTIPRYHPRHKHLFRDHSIDKHEGFNPDFPTGVSWVKTLPRLNQTQIDHMDDWHRARLRALRAVDEMVGGIFKKLEKAGQLDNTYVIYTSDNGFALGTHRRQPGKTLGFEEDTRVPLFIRGPGIPKGRVDTTGSWGIVDLSRTILELAGAKTSYENDGAVIDLYGKSDKAAHAERAVADAQAQAAVAAPAPASKVSEVTPKHALSEYWVLAVEEGPWATSTRENNTYRTLRVADGEHRYSYSVWCTGERELYDLNEDPHQVRNLLKGHNDLGLFPAFNATGTPSLAARALDQAGFDNVSRDASAALSEDTRRVAERLDALLLVLKTCQGEVCRQPWKTLFPSGQVNGFVDALKQDFDGYFSDLPRVHFDGCSLGYQARREHPLWDDALAWK